jgi:wobble nucleotide-excising tRNase
MPRGRRGDLSKVRNGWVAKAKWYRLACALGVGAMLRHIQLLRNIGTFDSITPGAGVPFGLFNLVYAENGRGKTTLADLFRSLGNGDASVITHPPHVILALDGGGTCSFQTGGWSAGRPTLAVFDDHFVAENVCSGVEIETGHRQNLHELILGAQGVALSGELQRQVAAVEEHNRNLRLRDDAIPPAAKGGLTTEKFCALKADPKIDEKIQEAERALAAARAAERVGAAPEYQALTLPEFDLDALQQTLSMDLSGLDRDAAAKVQAHISTLGARGEQWVGEGMNLVRAGGQSEREGDCPFCEQPLSGSPVIAHYRSYFGAGYTELKAELASVSRALNSQHSGEVMAAFERDVRITGERREFWAQFAEMPTFMVDTAAVARAWKAARDVTIALVARKLAAPLDAVAVDAVVQEKVDAYDRERQAVYAAARPLLERNHEIALVKEKARTADVTTLTAELGRLSIIKRRFTPAVVAVCDAYLAEKAAKKTTEAARDAAREALEQYRRTIFPAYQSTINDYLGRFGAAFRLADVGSVNTRAGSSATYTVLINNQPVGLASDTGPSFRNTLSAGDRNTLALAFFFASLEQDPNLGDVIVVVDDPMSSLDDHRTLVTVEELVKMARRVKQMIVLSHSKPFLLSLWKSGPKNSRAAMRISRVQSGSTFEEWRANDDAITEHDRRYSRVQAYISASNPAIERTVAADLRPMLEAWGRVAYPVEFPPEEMLGGFTNRCEQIVGTANEALKQDDIDELRGITNYANLFHHDTNPTFATEHINDQQLAQFAARTLRFIRKA